MKTRRAIKLQNVQKSCEYESAGARMARMYKTVVRHGADNHHLKWVPAICKLVMIGPSVQYTGLWSGAHKRTMASSLASVLTLSWNSP